MYFILAGVICLPLGLIVGADGVDIRRLLVASAVSGIIHIFYSMPIRTGYSKADLGAVYSVARDTGPLVTVNIAVTFIGDRPAILALSGRLVIIARIVVVIRLRSSSAGIRNGPHMRHGNRCCDDRSRLVAECELVSPTR